MFHKFQSSREIQLMSNLKPKAALIIFSVLLGFAFTLQQAQARTRSVNCDLIVPQSIQDQLDRARPGDVIEVQGTCSENIVIRKSGITLRGILGATLDGPDTATDTILVERDGVVIEDFATISGGRDVIRVHRAASAVIQNNTTISGGDQNCINVVSTANATITGNTIQNCGNRGIIVRRASSGRIFTNTITGNGNHGIQVRSAAFGDISENIVTDNVGDGIVVARNAHIRLSNNSSNSLTNTLLRNGGFGVRCSQTSSITVGTSQTFGAGGDANLSGDSFISSNCAVGGTL